MTLKEDLISGAEDIADFCGVPIRRVYGWVKTAVPVFAVGGVIYARRSELERYFSASGSTT